ncbi:MAG: toxin-antitoxin system HicB family antitoxin [Clostridia bacterium]|nr:toxin-antitoxin system HicB family antitoxin [Clostridia bacterium]
MRTLEEYMTLPYRLEIIPDSDEGGFVVAYPDLRGCLSSGETIEAAIANAEDAKREWLAAAMAEGCPIPEPASDEEYSGQFKLRIPRSLHRQLAMQSKKEGISMNQYCLYLLSQNNALHI